MKPISPRRTFRRGFVCGRTHIISRRRSISVAYGPKRMSSRILSVRDILLLSVRDLAHA
jgi:hypothetical protein